MIALELPSKTVKLADTDHPVHPLLQQRWSPRAFAPRVVERAKLLSLLEAARWSPSGGNQQPWFFFVGVQGDATFDQLASCLNSGNAEWAAAAPVLLMSVAQTVSSEGKPMRYALHDVGMAEMSLIIQSTALDLYAHPMAGFSVERARVAFALPDGYEPVVMLALGYLGEPGLLNERRRRQELEPRTRKPLHEFVFAEAWSAPAALLG
jgi:nitroreductase